MANKKISDLDALGTTPAVGDIIPITDVSGTPTTKSVTVANLMLAAPVQSVAGRTGAVSIANTDVSGLGTAATTDSSAYATAAQGTLAVSATQPGDLGTAASKNVGTSNGNVVELDATGLPAVDGSQLTNLPSPDVNGPLNTALRGTDNPHIGAYPNQSLKVLSSNPSGSALMVADSIGLKFAVGSSANVFVVKGASVAPSRLAEASELPSFSISKDSGEPDIELTDSDGEKYSVVNGDSDTLGANGLPIRQGYQATNMGANPSPLLISGGTIS